MKERERPVIEHILALIKSFQNKQAEAEEQNGLPVSNAEEIQTACELMDFMEEMPGGFLIYQADGEEEIIYANQGLLRLFRCGDLKEFRELTGNSFRGMVHPEDLEAVEESIRRQVAASQFDLDYVEYRIIRKDGALRWVEDYGHFVRSKTVGDIFYVFLVDATEKMDRQEEEKARLLQEKKQSEEKWMHLKEAYDQERALVNQEQTRRLDVIKGLGVNHESIFYLDLGEDKILPYRHSDRTESIFNTLHHTLDYSKWICQYIQDWVHPEDRERMERETASDAIRRRLEDSASFALNYRVVDQGETQYLQLRFDSVGEKEQPAQIVMGCRRVDEELQRELKQKQALEQALHDAQLSIVAKNTFLSNMSHDMRTPLNAIFGYTTLAKNSLDSPQTAEGYLDHIEASSRQLLDFVDKVLKLSWMDSKEIQAEESACSLAEILAEVHSFLLPQAQEKEIDFSLDCSQVRHDAVYGDREKLGQIVMYLANNAVTYTQPGGSVTITAAEREELPHDCAVYQIEVRDTGIGIGKDFLAQIFEPFTRERNTTLSGIHGVGLGLTIARNLAELLGGTIDVESSVGRGSAFTITLRLRTRSQEGPEAPPAEEETAEEELPEEMPVRCRILLVEDNALNREIETEILKSLDFPVETAGNGREAVEKLQAAGPEYFGLILMDIQMPVMNGWEATKAIRALPDPVLSRIPIVALSANVFESDMQRSLELGMNAHLAKPVDVPELLGTIEKIMRLEK